jgi:hypothetical protein
LRKRAYFFRASAESGIPPNLSTFASKSPVRGKTLSIGIRTGLILPERFEITARVRFDVVDGIVKCFVQIVRWDDDFCKGILVLCSGLDPKCPDEDTHVPYRSV